jgi:7-cyano-7-deazaguanine synthase in queuosine biosynthesis
VAADVLLNLSGGIDSALCLWRAQQEGRRVLTHHIVLATSRGRERHEAQAVDRILGWMPEPTEHVESSFGWGDLQRVRDVHVWALFTGAILARRPAVGEVIVPTHADAFTTMDEPWRQRSAEALDEIVYAVARRRPVYSRPLAGMTKAQIIAEIPDDLLDLCWWCRTPTVRGKPCHRCLTCRQVDRARGR